MKKILLRLGLVLVVLFVVLSLFDKSAYRTEKRLWRIQKQFEEIARDPNVIPEKNFEEVAEQYRKVIKAFPKSELLPHVYLQIGRVYALKKDYERARKEFQSVMTRYPKKEELCAQALLSIGLTYETEKKESRAVATYRNILDQYPLTDVGLNMYLYLANYYLQVNKPTESNAVLREGEAFYKKISRENPKTPLEFNALRFLVTTYYAQKDWRPAVETLGKILSEYSSSRYLTVARANLLLRSINTVSLTQLKDYDLPAQIYEGFIKDHPGHPLNRSLEEMVRALKELKRQNVVIGTKN